MASPALFLRFLSLQIYVAQPLYRFIRIILNYTYIRPMKERLNLTIDRELLETMKVYAAGKDMSLSELVENYFISVTKSIRHNNILDLMDRLEPPVARGTRGREGGI